MEWKDCAIATCDDDILRHVFEFIDTDARAFGYAACVCRAWRTVATDFLKSRRLYMYGDYSCTWEPTVATMDPAQPRIVTRSVSARRERKACELAAASHKVTCVTWHPTIADRVIAGFADGGLRAWSTRTGQTVGTFSWSIREDANTSLYAVTHFAVSQDGQWGLFCDAGGFTQLFQSQADPAKFCFECVLERAASWGPSPVTWAEFVPHAENLVAVCANAVCVFNFVDNTILWDHSAGAVCVRFTPDGTTSATLTRSMVHIHRVDSREELARFELSLGATPPVGMTWSPDGRRLLVGTTGAPSFVVDHLTARYAIGPPGVPACWSSDGRRLFFPGCEGVMWLDVDEWLTGRACIKEDIARSQKHLNGLAFSHDLKACVVVKKNATVCIFAM